MRNKVRPVIILLITVAVLCMGIGTPAVAAGENESIAGIYKLTSTTYNGVTISGKELEARTSLQFSLIADGTVAVTKTDSAEIKMYGGYYTLYGDNISIYLDDGSTMSGTVGTGFMALIDSQTNMEMVFEYSASSSEDSYDSFDTDIVNEDSYIKDIRNTNVGDYVIYGSYEQDNNLFNGKEPIEWEILDVQDGKVLLLSRYGLDCQPYNRERTDVTWETCTLRAWLNGEFLNTAFSPAETAMIVETKVVNADNPYYGTEGGNNTVDRVFLLSLEEIEKYYGIGPDKWWSADNDAPQENLICKLTDYGVKRMKEIFVNDNGYTVEEAEKWYKNWEKTNGRNWCVWYLRSPGDGSMRAACIGSDGVIGDYGDYVDHADGAVRPVLWVNLDS